jgi:hypothetical protein
MSSKLTPIERSNHQKTFWVFFFLSMISVLFSSGRIGNADAHSQLMAAYVFVSTGQFGSVVPPGGFEDNVGESGSGSKPLPKSFFWEAPNGLYYQTHDIGNVAMMLPIAAVWNWAFFRPGALEEDEIPRPIKALTSIYFSLLSGLAATALFACLSLSLPFRESFYYSVLFLFTSFFLTYTRMPWDVAGAGAFAIVAFYFLLRARNENRLSTCSTVLMAASTGIATNFRCSFGPFLVLIIFVALLPYRSCFSIRHVSIFCITIAIIVTPSFIYNYVRTGNPLHPATVIPRYPTKPELSWAAFDHLWRMYFSLNKGLFVYSPVILFAFTAKQKADIRLMIAVVVGLIGYSFGLASTKSWSGGASWGPRYLVPLLPILFYLAAVQIDQHGRVWKRLATVFFITGFFVNLPTFVSNYQLAINEFPAANNDLINLPYPQFAAWRGFFSGLAGNEIPIRDEIKIMLESGQSKASTTFPDLLIVHIANEIGFLGGFVVSAVLLLGLTFGLLKVTSNFTPKTIYSSGAQA